jgi:anaerobic glycerol-3-phosphate dehydrogenase
MVEPARAALPVVVVGAGFAGAAAAWMLARSGVAVVVIHARAGSSSLYAGLVEGPVSSAEAQEFALHMGLSMGGVPRAIATREGVIRSVPGRDRSVLDLDALAGRRIGVPDVRREDWDARLLCDSFRASAWARRSRTDFVLVPVDTLTQGAERRIPVTDFARLFDASAHRGALAGALRAVETKVEGWLFGPWLGAAGDAASQLAALMSCPVGETTSGPGGVAGARFDLRRDALFAEVGIGVRRARVTALEPAPSHVAVQLEGYEPIRARAVVLALGGVAAGGIELVRSNAEKLGFRLSLAAPASLWLDGEAVDAGSSLWGPSFQRVGFGALERVGIEVDSAGRVVQSARLFACGDVVHNRPRNVGEAISAGIAVAKTVPLLD